MYKNKKLQEKYEQTLKNVKENYGKVDKVLEELPDVCEDYVIRTMKKETTCRVLDEYKNIYFSWGVCRWRYSESNTPTNYKDTIENPIHLNKIYINTLNLYASHNNYGLEAISSLCFYFDALSSVFYCTDEELPEVLEALNEWYKRASNLACKDAKEKEKEKLLKQLEALNNTECN